MKLPGLINLGLIFIMASNSKGEDWSVNVTRRINATLGSDVTIPCTFTYPTKFHTKDVKVWWKMSVTSPIEITDNNKHAFIFHPDDSNVIEEYRGRTKLIGNKTAGNCSLQILNVTKNVANIYLRVFGNLQKWSFIKESVSIFVSSPGVQSFTSKPDIPAIPPTSGEVGLQSASKYPAIFVPVAAVILFVTGIVFYIRHKRSQSFTREESGYYANFSQASSNQAEREASCNKQENKKLPEVKAIDEPIYINTEAPLGQMDQSMDDMDNVYANVDYTK
ncbi:myelin-associated glycoprotein-like isoform X2 [Epinephelus moara]|nr:myelin-associated glycoprotein-like isoform X2 [Epinephelus moara]